MVKKSRQRVPRTRNSGQWTEARYRQFIQTALRRASLRWGPRNEVKRDAKVERGIYICASCKKRTRNKDIQIDHIIPVVDPEVGFQDWNTYISRMFCEKDNLQAICKTCHKKKTDGKGKK